MTKYFDNINEILKILAAGSFEDLAGAVENDIFETKGKPSNLERKLEKFELAKDVASMANWRGGIILVGVVAKSTLTPPGMRSRRSSAIYRRLWLRVTAICTY